MAVLCHYFGSFCFALSYFCQKVFHVKHSEEFLRKFGVSRETYNAKIYFECTYFMSYDSHFSIKM